MLGRALLTLGILCASPALQASEESYPNKEITLVTHWRRRRHRCDGSLHRQSHV